MRTKTQELTAIRNAVMEVAELGLKAPRYPLVYRTFGSLSKEQAQGLVVGLNVAIRLLYRKDKED